jgi:hypothetical protein
VRSLLQTEKVCFKTGDTHGLHKHHIYGGPNRNISEKIGAWVWLRGDWHNLSDYGVHFDKAFDLELKRLFQREYEKLHTRAEFMSLIGRNFL